MRILIIETKGEKKMNQVSLLGRLVRPIELQEVGSDRVVCNNTLAIQRLRKKNDTQPQADFIPVVFWGNTARLLHQYCGKGNQIGVNGHLTSRSYTNKQEQQVFVVELIAEEIHFVESKKEATSTEPIF